MTQKDRLKERILAFMRLEAYKPLTAEELAAALELKGKSLNDFWPLLEELEAEAAILKTRYGKYGVPERMNLVVGRFFAHSRGYGFVVPEQPDASDVFIPPDATLQAMHNDRVIARVHFRRPGPEKRCEGEIIRIIQRANPRIVGTVELSRHYGFVVPDDSRLGKGVLVPRDELNGARGGSRVVAEITRWPERQRNAEGRVVEVLGHRGDPGVEVLAIIKKHGLATAFPPEVERAAAKVPSSVRDEDLAGRRDLRDKLIVTIDSEDAKDLDDAVRVERLKNGRYLLGVHIADVSYYVQENSALDKEAQARGTSVYLVDRVLPMLPPRLSNGICSLNAGEDRLTLSAEMEIDHRGAVLAYELFPSVIRVSRRLTYTAVRRILAEGDEALRQEYADLVPMLEEMERLCLILRNRRLRRGAIDFDLPEIKVRLDADGKPLEIVRRSRSIAESIIEEFMLAANETVAEHMSRQGVPFVFRVHEEPDPEKMAKLNDLLHNFGQTLGNIDHIRPQALQDILGHIAGRPEERLISTVMLRSLKQARYEAENLGHFGLAAKCYTHFTSPIRRYPDLVVHRLLRETFSAGEVSAKRREKLGALLPKIALQASERERAAAEAERETVDLKKVEYMTGFIGEEFAGIISGVASFGLFVELDNGVEGLVRVSSMDDDYYHYDEDSYALSGERSGKVYRLGDEVRIRVARTNPLERSIDFILVADASPTRPPRRASGAAAARRSAAKTDRAGKTKSRDRRKR